MIGLAMMLAANATLFTNAATLRADCQKTGKPLERCLTYLKGVVDAATLVQSLHPEDQSICIADDTTLDQIKDSTVRYSEANPQYDDFSGAAVVTLALAGDFPCPVPVAKGV